MASRKRKGFFALDVDQFERAADLGLESAAAYLALMAGTDQSNTVSAWGINAIATHTGLTRHEAKQAVACLKKNGLVQPLEGAKTRAWTIPRYSLPVRDTRKPLAPKEQAALDAIQAGNTPKIQDARRAAQKGWIKKVDGLWVEVPVLPNCAFMPNSFIRTETGNSPLARILNTGELNPLKLAVRLYRRQNLMEARGVPLDDVRQHYHARTEQLGQLPYKLIELLLGREWEGVSFPEVACPSIFALESEEFWPALKVLEHCHVVEWAVYTTNGKPVREYDYGRPAKPVGVVRNGRLQTQAPESKPGLLAYMIGRAHLDGFTDTAEVVRDWGESNALMAVENASVRHIEGVGILRMTHRADTDNAKAWWRQINEESRKAVFFYETVAKETGCEVPDMEGENRIEAAFA